MKAADVIHESFEEPVMKSRMTMLKDMIHAAAPESVQQQRLATSL